MSPFILWSLRSFLALYPDVVTETDFSFENCGCRGWGRHGRAGGYRSCSVAFENRGHLLLTRGQCVEAAHFLSLQ